MLGGLWLFQWAHLALVGLDTGLWDMTFTFAEDRLKPSVLRLEAPVAERYREAVARAEQLTPVDGRLGRSYHDLGVLLWLFGRPREGRLYLRRSLEVFEKSDGPGSVWVGMACWRLGQAELNEPGHRAQGLALLERAERNLLRGRGPYDTAFLQVTKLLTLQLRDPMRARRLVSLVPDSPLGNDPTLLPELKRILSQAPTQESSPPRRS